MKNFKLLLIILCILLFNNNVLATSNTVTGSKEVYAQSIKISDSPRTIIVGQSSNLKAVITPSTTTNKKVTWESSDKSILTVDKNGKITGIKRGTVKVTARTSNGKKDSISITVRLNNTTTQGKKVSSVAIISSPNEVLVGNEFQIKTSISPKYVDNPELKYSSSNTKVIQIDQNGYAKAVGKGKAKITVESTNGKKAYKTIKVKNIEIVLDKKEIKIKNGTTTNITATIKSVTKDSVKNVKWTSSSTGIATVKEKSVKDNSYTATITAKSKGKANIVVRIDDESISIPVTVTEYKVDDSLECPIITYDDSMNNNDENAIIKMNLSFKNNIDRWDYYVSTNKKTGSNASWKKQYSNYQGNNTITSHYFDAQGKIVIYSKQGTIKNCYTVPFEIGLSKKNTSVSVDKNLVCPNIQAKYEIISGKNKKINNGIITGVKKVTFTITPVNLKKYQYSWLYNYIDEKNANLYSTLDVPFRNDKTFNLQNSFSLSTSSFSYPRSGKVIVINQYGNVKECQTNYYSDKDDLSGPQKPLSPNSNETIEKLNKIALEQVGNTGQKYENWFGFYADWCAMFVSWLFNQVQTTDKKYIVFSAGAGEIPRSSVKAGLGVWYEDECTDSSTVPKAGDIILFNPRIYGMYVPYPANGHDKYYSSHIGYVYKVDDNYVYTVEGNGSKGGYNGVWKKQYIRKHCSLQSSKYQYINGYFRPNY